MEIKILHKGDPLSWALAPLVFDRIKKFNTKYECDLDSDKLVSLTQQHFVSAEPLMLMLAGLDNGTLVGHCLASIDTVLDKKYVTVVQVESDIPMKDEDAFEVWRILEVWGLSMKAKTAQLITNREGLARYFKKYGFAEYKIQMRRPIGE